MGFFSNLFSSIGTNQTAPTFNLGNSGNTVGNSGSTVGNLSFMNSLTGFTQSSSAGNSSSSPITPTPAAYAPTGGWLGAVDDAGAPQTDSKDVFDQAGNVLKLGAKDEKGSGGEGTVYEFPQNGRILVKIYKDDILKDARKMGDLRRRITDMVNLETCAKMPFLAWPLMPAMNSRKEIIGFAMRKCSGFSFLTLRGPRFIKQRFPGWTRRHLALTALDFVKKAKLLAANNVLINDFNPANFYVNDKCEVSFIDCDSYQVPSSPHGVNITRTFFPSHVAPELLRNKRLLDAPRTIRQVEFGVALTVFNILMCGLHPYNFCDASHKSACGTPDENLLKGRCPLGTGSDCFLPKGGWYNLWSWLTFDLKSTFIKMFKDGHANLSVRPSLDDLQRGIEQLLIEMKRTPERMDMEPMKPKPATRNSPSGARLHAVDVF